MAQRNQFHEITASTDAGLPTRAGEQFRRYHDLSQWVLPVWIGLGEFAALHVSLFSLVALGVIRLRRWSSGRGVDRRQLLHGTATVSTFVVAAAAAVLVSAGTGVFAGLTVVSGLYAERRLVLLLPPSFASRFSEHTPDAVTRTRVRALGAVAFSLVVVGYAASAFPIREVLLDGPPGRQMTLLLHLAVAGLIVATGTRPTDER